MNSIRGGMQVHAVPESERAFDASGKRLPWGYEFADADLGRRREPEERGPFGRSTRRRGFSRSKTATPARKEDAARLENMQWEDAIFNKYVQEQRVRDPAGSQQQQQQQQQTGGASQSATDANTAANTSSNAQTKEPTEVIIYGFGPDAEWAALEYYERVSGGYILEDYNRHPPHQYQRYDLTMSNHRAQLQRSLSQAALKKRNEWRGGRHWIKITFDSPDAADRACHVSPHAIHGFLVYAEPYRGTAPPTDAPIPYSNAGAQVDTATLPKSFSTNTVNIGKPSDSPSSSNTLSSATATGQEANPQALPSTSTVSDFSRRDPFDSSRSMTTATQHSPTVVQQRPMRVPGATRAVLLPADQAFLPAPPRYAGILASLPLIGLFFGKTDVIGSQVPRCEDGTFDWKTASLYWCFFAWLDLLLGTDICGLKGDD